MLQVTYWSVLSCTNSSSLLPTGLDWMVEFSAITILYWHIVIVTERVVWQPQITLPDYTTLSNFSIRELIAHAHWWHNCLYTCWPGHLPIILLLYWACLLLLYEYYIFFSYTEWLWAVHILNHRTECQQNTNTTSRIDAQGKIYSMASS